MTTVDTPALEGNAVMAGGVAPRRVWTPAMLAALWRRPDGRAVVATGDIRAVYAFLQQVGFSQRQIAMLARQSQSEVSEILAGRQVRTVTVLARICAGLCLPPAAFGLAGTTPPTTPAACSAVAALPPVAGPRVPCLCTTQPAPGTQLVPLDTPDTPAVVPLQWTGVEMRALRLALQQSVREFAAVLGVSHRSVSKWEAGGAAITPRGQHQSAADIMLDRATPRQRARFAAWLTQPTTPTDDVGDD